MKIESHVPAGVNVMLASGISNPQDVNEPRSFTRLIVMLPVNGPDYRIVVEESTLSTGAVSRTTSKNRVSNKHATTDQTRTPSTTKKATSTEFATVVTTDGTQQTTPTTTPTSAGKEINVKRDKLGRKYVGRPTIYAKRDREIYRDHKAGMSYLEISLKHGITKDHASVICSKQRRANKARMEKARAARGAARESA